MAFPEGIHLTTFIFATICHDVSLGLQLAVAAADVGPGVVTLQEAVRSYDNSAPYSYYRVKKLLGNQTMKIGDLATRAGCKVQTVRYYESEGLAAGTSP